MKLPIVSALLFASCAVTALGATPAAPGSIARPESFLAPAAVFGDRMVLQRGMPVPVWGKADPGARVVVAFAGRSKAAVAGEDGRWMLKLDPMEADATGREMTIACGEAKTVFKDVLVGEVWLCSGQSNMEMGVYKTSDAATVDKGANDPLLRVRAINKVTTPLPSDVLPTASPWLTDSPQALHSGAWGGFSAAAYFFAKHLRHELKDVPVAVIQSAWGGTCIEPWTPPEGFAQVPSLKNLSDWCVKVDADYRKVSADIPDKLKHYQNELRIALENHRPLPMPPSLPLPPVQGPGAPTSLYNAHIHPLVPYAIRGALWYQGESNLIAGDTGIYADKMKALVGGWRTVWSEGDFPFYFVRIAPYKYAKDGHNKATLPEFWEAQDRAAHTIPNAGMADTLDIGNYGDIHPKNKREVGRRLALLAMANTYGRKDIVCEGPRFNSFTVDGPVLRVTFDHTDGGLKTRDGKPPAGFEVAGEDGDFAVATAEIKDGDVLLRSDKVPAPTQARYDWNENPSGNLANGAGLPMGAFRTPGPVDLALHAPYVTGNPNTHGWGATGQLTDGSWAPDAGHCFATDEDEKFPKDVTLDLGSPQTVSRVKFGVPPFGSTKTIVVSTGTDGRSFTEVGRHIFEQEKTGTAVVRFAPREVRFIRLTAPDHHAKEVRYPAGFIFLTEAEAYAK